MAQYVPSYSEFYERTLGAYNVLQQVAMKLSYWNRTGEEPDHGITFLLRPDAEAGEGRTALDDHLEDTMPYNGVPHNLLNDEDIADVVASKRTLDGACIVDQTGEITHANFFMPMNHVEYKQKYGIQGKLRDFLNEEDSHDGLGARKLSALYASDVFDGVIIMTLHERNAQGQNEISVWYKGARIFNSAGRKTRWEMAHTYPLPMAASVERERYEPRDPAAELAKLYAAA
ncbi:hypothetical protein KY363_02625 [Candidatus Woesearchaeota archaeon]|nr:hypothetical protein [Candidatus Woesearchaeota archaeon]